MKKREEVLESVLGEADDTESGSFNHDDMVANQLVNAVIASQIDGLFRDGMEIETMNELLLSAGYLDGIDDGSTKTLTRIVTQMLKRKRSELIARSGKFKKWFK